LQAGADRAGRGIEAALLRAVRTGKLGFEDLKRVASQIMAEIAAEAVRGGMSALFGGGGGSGIGAVIGSLFGLPGRATGGPVAPERAYVVGERGPELFVPTSSGRVEVPVQGGGREVRVAITGRRVSPPLFESMELLGRDAVLARIERLAASV
jgi:phage-related minor tail protein